MSTKFKEHLGYIDWQGLTLYPSSDKALKVRADRVIAEGRKRCPIYSTVADNKMYLHRLKCGQSIAVPYVNSYPYKDALKFRVRYYNEISHCHFLVIKHRELNLFEIARMF